MGLGQSLAGNVGPLGIRKQRDGPLIGLDGGGPSRGFAVDAIGPVDDQPGGDFRLFIQKLGYQALIGMGVLENPLTKAHDTNLDHAQMVINDLMMLRDRTQGNLKDGEEEHLEQVIGDLQRHFVELSQTAS